MVLHSFSSVEDQSQLIEQTAAIFQAMSTDLGAVANFECQNPKHMPGQSVMKNITSQIIIQEQGMVSAVARTIAHPFHDQWMTTSGVSSTSLICSQPD